MLYEVAFNLPLNKVFTYSPPEKEDIDIGYRVTAPFGSRLLKGYVVNKRVKPPPGVPEIKAISHVIDNTPVFDQKLLDLAHWISRMYICSLGEALSAILPGGKKELSGKELLFPENTPLEKKEISPARQQKTAIDEICRQKEGIFYLHGVTGSGKTYVYLQVARQVLADGRDVIYLVPEISLTHQVVDICISEFGNTVAVLHSGLTPSRRLKEWMRIRRGEARFVIGARSAVFAPVNNLGLVVVDEEHEGAYKASSTPRYHARQVAFKRCAGDKAICIMGSATPSLEAYYQIQTHQLTSFQMPDRLSGGKMPAIEVVDMKEENGPFSRRLVEEIKETHKLGRQTILFLNRRGFSYYFHCRSCGFEMKCRHCSVTLTFHKQKWKMICHYCGYAREPINMCPDCRSLDVGYSGFGTEKIEEDLKKIFPRYRIERIDTDTVRKRGKLKQIITDFRDKKIDILLGTQMVAKGLNFPGVQLVGIISADTGLNLPDFRAAERTHHLIVQVSGRSGRVNPEGKVIVQTLRPHNDAIKDACRMRSKDFYEKELAVRDELGFPPFSRLIRLVFRGKKEEETFKTARLFYDTIKNQIKECADILGPAECPLSVIAKNHRYQLIFRTKTMGTLHRHLRDCLLGFKTPTGVYCEVDVDPVSLL